MNLLVLGSLCALALTVALLLAGPSVALAEKPGGLLAQMVPPIHAGVQAHAVPA